MNPKGQTKTRYELFFNKKPNSMMKIRKFGSKVYYNINSTKTKLDDRAREGIFVGVNDVSQTYRVYDPVRRCIVTSRDVVFFSKQPGYIEMFEKDDEKLIVLGERDESEEREEVDEEERKEVTELNQQKILSPNQPILQQPQRPPQPIQQQQPQHPPQPIQQQQQQPLPQQQQQLEPLPPDEPVPRRNPSNKPDVRRLKDNLKNQQPSSTAKMGNSRYPNRRNNNNNININNINNNNDAIVPNEAENNNDNINDNINNDDDNNNEVIINNNNNDNNNNNIDDEEYNNNEDPDESLFHLANSIKYPVPRSYREAMNSPDREKWIEAMEREKASLYEMSTWDEIQPPKDKPIIGSRWVFAVKLDAYGIVSRYKARLVARGDKQKKGINYNETFSPTLRSETIRYLISYAVHVNLELHHLDVETAYLNGDVDEEIYMKLPEGFNQRETKIAKLSKALYGLKQAGRRWHKKFVASLLENGFKQSNVDPCVFTKEDENGAIIAMLGVFVDDLLVAAETNQVALVKNILMNQFKMKDLGELSWFLSIKIERNEDNIQLSQTAFIDAMLERFSMNDCKPYSTPLPETIETGTPQALMKYDNIIRYQQIVGSLNYLATMTRPDITYAVNILARKMTQPTLLYYNYAKRILHYLKGTRELKLTFTNSSNNLIEGFSDASFAENKEDRTSTGGYVFMMNGGAVSWKTEKQKIVTLSSTEAEYVALSHAAREAIWLRRLAEEHQHSNAPMILHEDNQSTIKTAKDRIFNCRTKHIDTYHHFVRQKVEEKELEIIYIPSEIQTADIFTKPLGRKLHEFFVKKLGLL
jgi:hypothetical protein